MHLCRFFLTVLLMRHKVIYTWTVASYKFDFFMRFMHKWMFSKQTHHQELVYIIWLTHTSVQLLIYCGKIPGEKHNWEDYLVCWKCSNSNIVCTTGNIFYNGEHFLNVSFHSRWPLENITLVDDWIWIPKTVVFLQPAKIIGLIRGWNP